MMGKTRYTKQLCYLAKTSADSAQLGERLDKVKGAERCESIGVVSDYLFLLGYYAPEDGQEETIEGLRNALLKRRLCPSEQLLLDYAMGTIDDRGVKRYIRAHLAVCDRCDSYVQQFKQRTPRRTIHKLLHGLQGNINPAILNKLERRLRQHL